MPSRKRYVCSNCGHEELRWSGRCPGCDEWNTLVEATTAEAAAPSGRVSLVDHDAPPAKVTPVADVELLSDEERISTGISEFDRVLGGGLVEGAYVLVGGEPGSGKSTLAAQAAIRMSARGLRAFMTSGEESEKQVKMRLTRIAEGDLPVGIGLSSEMCAERIYRTLSGGGYDVAIIDSVNCVFSERVGGEPGGMAQMRAAAAIFEQAAKQTGTPIFLIGQVTKDNTIAGPRALEHAVDAFLLFEGDRRDDLRILRAMKNRFGAVSEIGVFEMGSQGLTAIDDPSRLFLGERAAGVPGVVITCALEGSRPLLCEIQALTAPVPYQGAQPRREANGFDRRRLTMLLAVLHRKARFSRLSSSDVFLNVANGLKVDEPALDLSACVALASSLTGRPVKDSLCVLGEVTLIGDVRRVAQFERRQREAERQGLKAPMFRGDLRAAIEQCLEPHEAEPAIESSATELAA